MKRLLFAALIFAPMAMAMAQDDMMAPPKEVSDLGWMVGTWSGTGKFTMEGQTMDMTVTQTCSFEGQFMKSVSVNEMTGFKMTEAMMLGWDAAKKQYVSYSFTNIAPTPRIERGTLTDGKMVMVSDPWDLMGTSYVSRSTVTKVSDTKCRFVLEFKDGDKWTLATDVEMTKK